MKLFISMLFSGSMLFLCFLVMVSIGKEHLSIWWRSAFLKLCFFFSLVPVALFKGLVASALSKMIGLEERLDFTVSGQEEVLIMTSGGFQMTTPLRAETLIIVIWFIVGTVIFLYHVWGYFLRRKQIIRFMKKDTNPTTAKILEHYKRKMKIRWPITIYTNDIKISPFTTGVWKPIIVIPSGLQQKNQEMVIHHELCHIKSGDNLYGFLRLFMLSLYWFNPLFYLMDYHIEKILELVCDTKVTSGKSEELKAAYSHLIISMIPVRGQSYICAISHHKKDIEERVRNVMKTRKTTKKEKAVLAVLSTFMILVSSTPVWAYQSPEIVRIDQCNTQPVYIPSDASVSFMGEGVTEVISTEKILFDIQFIDTDGNIYDAENADRESRSCNHTYKDGTYTNHQSHSDGGCTIKYYAAQRCTQCGHVMIGELENEVTYKVCPH